MTADLDEPAAPVTPPDPVPACVVTNRRPRLWPGWFTLIAVGFLTPVLCVLHPIFAIAAVVLAAGATWPNGTRTVGLADLISVWPANRHFAPERIAVFEVGQDPLEDYADDDEPLCELKLVFHRGPTVRMIISTADANRALRWAAAKGVAVRVTHPGRGGPA